MGDGEKYQGVDLSSDDRMRLTSGMDKARGLCSLKDGVSSWQLSGSTWLIHLYHYPSEIGDPEAI